MKGFLSIRMLALAVSAWIIVSAQTGAQTLGVFIRNPSTNPVPIGSTLTYSISVTNLLGVVDPTLVTSTISGPGIIIGAVPALQVGTLITSNATSVVFSFSADLAQFDVSVQATGLGLITSSVFVSSATVTNPVTASVVNEVTNSVANATADLAVTITGPAQAVIVNDYMPYDIIVSNLGPDAAPNVLLTNAASEFLIVRGIVPTNTLGMVTNDLLVLNLGTLNSGGTARVRLTVQPTNSGPLTISAGVGSDVNDPNPTNNSTSAVINVTNYLAGQVASTNVSDMVLDPQTGLMEQTVRLTNVGSNDLAAARLVVSGLTNWLYNAAGTNDGNPFVYYANTLGTNQSVDLLLEYFVPARLPIDVTNYAAFEVPPVNLAPQPGTPFDAVVRTNLAPGRLLVEFPATNGLSYTILYADNPGFTNAMTALSTLIAPADRVQWIDAGPPETISAPSNSTARFYRVLPNP